MNSKGRKPRVPVIPDTIVVSSPRSGLNWIRYNVEFFSKKRTPGIPKLIRDNNIDLIFARTHNVNCDNSIESGYAQFWQKHPRIKKEHIKTKPLYKKCLLLIRDYHDIYSKAKSEYDNAFQKKASCQKPEKICENSMKTYIANIEAYDLFEGEKIVIYYEDLISDYEQMKLILDFMQIDYSEKMLTFDVKEHTKRSMKWYNKAYSTRSASTSIPPKERKMLDEYLTKNHKDIFDKYLLRYK